MIQELISTVISPTLIRAHINAAADTPGFIWLDSSDSASKWSRHSFAGLNPILFITAWQNGRITIRTAAGQWTMTGNPFDLIERILAACRTSSTEDALPFTGGLITSLSYEAIAALPDFSGVLKHPLWHNDNTFPILHAGIYNHILSIDHLRDTGTYHHTRVDTAAVTRLLRHETGQPVTLSGEGQLPLKEKPTYTGEEKPFWLESDITSCFTKETYLAAVDRAKQYIYEGDIYQVNLSHRFSAPYGGNLFSLYNTLRRISPAPFSAYFKTDTVIILSASPERYVRIEGNLIETRPIKGTMPRGRTPEEDSANKQQLLHSAKDNAELAMIVDLERNDLGSICRYGSVTVPELRVLEEYAQVFHLVSTIRGKLKAAVTPWQAVQRLFPGGSITGAPKRRAMEIIRELEPVPRNTYTGVIGYIGFNGQADFNIAIRTLYADTATLHFHAGGGIVADSNPDSEWRETLAKAKGIFASLENTAGGKTLSFGKFDF